MSLHRTFGLTALLFLLPPLAAAFDELIDSPMYTVPGVPVPPVLVGVSDETLDLWVKALERPEVEMRIRAAEAIDRAHRRGAKGLDRSIAPLQAAFDRPDQDATARLAIARAL